jgi:fatty-acyl-CoA synthase
MHGTGMWLGGFLSHLLGGCVVTTPNLGLDTQLLWKEVERVGITNIIIVGDSFAKPMVKELDRAVAENKPYNLETLKLIYSSGVMFSADVKASLLDHHDMVLMDAMGSSEGGMGSSVSTRADGAATAKFRLNPGVVVVSDEGEEVIPGSGVRGLIGTSGLVPEGYYKDKEKSDATFKEFNGTRYSFPGDYALVEADGTITLLGRGSNCINSAGEKIYPEEVEEALKLNSNVYDSLVVGLPDERFGNKVVGVVSLVENCEIDEAELISSTREHLSGYKLPKNIIFVSEVMRAPNGKADYKWAKKVAEAELI